MIKMISLILGGGAGSRLHPLTSQRSKPAVPIGGKYRLIDIPISNCLNSGVRRMFVVTQFNSASLNQHIKNTYHFDAFSKGFVDILAAEQTPTSKDWFQGTADAVRQSMHHLANHDHDYVLILSGDQLYQMDLEEFAKYHVKLEADLTIATIPVTDRDAPGFGIMKVNGEGIIESFTEKPKADILHEWQSEVTDANRKAGKLYIASMGIYIFSKNILKRLFEENPDAVDFGNEIIPYAINNGFKVASYSYEGYWTDIGTIRSFFEANIELADPIPQFNLFDKNQVVYTRPRLLPPAKIFGTWLNHSVLAEGSIIHAKKIERSIVGIRSRLGAKHDIAKSIIMGNDFFETIEEMRAADVPLGIGRDSYVEYAIVDKNARIGNNVYIRGSLTLPDSETDTHCVRDGIIVVKKGATIANGTRIGLGA